MCFRTFRVFTFQAILDRHDGMNGACLFASSAGVSHVPLPGAPANVSEFACVAANGQRPV